MRNVLVLGGAGYLGAVTTARLLAGGHRVTVVDTFEHGTPSLSFLTGAMSTLTIINQDQADFLRGHGIKGFDCIVPLAAVVGAPACDKFPTQASKTNLDDVLLLLSQNKWARIVYPNTNSGYGKMTARACVETDKLTPLSLYGRTKCSAEEAVVSLAQDYVVFRFATLFGPSPRMRMDLMVNDFVYQAMTAHHIHLFDGGFRRNFLHVHDAASAICLAVSGHIPKGVYNAGDDRANMTKRGLCAAIAEQVPFSLTEDQTGRSDPDQRDYLVSNEKLLSAGWVPAYSLQDGIRQLIQTYQQPFFKAVRNA